MKKVSLIWILALALTAFGCDTRPKDLTNNKLDFDDGDSTDTDLFKFKFAYRDTAAAAPLNQIVYLQAETDSKTTMISSCNVAGTNCVCEFLDSLETKILETTSADIEYDSNGNYFRCDFTGTALQLASLAKVRIRNLASTAVSDVLTVDTTLTAHKLLGDDLSMNYLRTINRYRCSVNYLEKTGTSAGVFDCTSSASLCGSGAAPTGDMCISKVLYPYFTYSSNAQSNNDLKPSSVLYNEAGDGKLCGIQIPQLECSGASGVPVAQFAIYAEAKGAFDMAIQMAPSPNTPVETYGYAARTSTFKGNTVCPPGMERRIFYTTTATAPTVPAQSPGNNVVATNAADVSTPTLTPTDLELNRYRGLDCTGTACGFQDPLLGIVFDSLLLQYPYAASGSEFCVIPTSLL